MSRRTATMVLAGSLLVVLVCAALLLPMPFVITGPGPTVDTLGQVRGRAVVAIQGHRTYPTKGSLYLTTVSVTSPDSRVYLPEAMQAWFDSRQEVLPRDVVYPPDQSVTQVQQQDAEQMQTSQQSAVVAALRLLGMSVPSAVVVHAISEGAPALGHLKAGDILRAVNGVEVDKPDQVGKALQQTSPGDAAAFVVERDGKTVEVRCPTEADPKDAGHTLVGITVQTGYDLPFDVRVRLGERIGGPSAGTMFALAIVDKLTPGSLTGGRVIAGTGEITPTGEVGPIGGVQQKMIAGASDAGASIFLVPASNCAEALGADAAASGIRLVKITTLRSAVMALHTLAKRPRAPVPSCSR